MIARGGEDHAGTSAESTTRGVNLCRIYTYIYECRQDAFFRRLSFFWRFPRLQRYVRCGCIAAWQVHRGRSNGLKRRKPILPRAQSADQAWRGRFPRPPQPDQTGQPGSTAAPISVQPKKVMSRSGQNSGRLQISRPHFPPVYQKEPASSAPHHMAKIIGNRPGHLPPPNKAETAQRCRLTPRPATNFHADTHLGSRRARA